MWRTPGSVVACHASLAILAICGCSAADSQPSTMQQDLPIVWEKSGTYSHLSRAVRILARDQATLAQVPVAEIPVDFATQMVLIAGLGPTPSSDLGVRITRVWQQGSLIRVQERQIHPGREQEPGLNPASPWTVVVIPRSDLNVEGYSVQVPPQLVSDRPSFGGGGGKPASSGAPSGSRR